MLSAQLEEIAKEGHTGDFGDALNLGHIGAVHVAHQEVDHRRSGDKNRLDSHDCGVDDVIWNLQFQGRMRATRTLYKYADRNAAVLGW